MKTLITLLLAFSCLTAFGQINTDTIAAIENIGKIIKHTEGRRVYSGSQYALNSVFMSRITQSQKEITYYKMMTWPDGTWSLYQYYFDPAKITKVKMNGDGTGPNDMTSFNVTFDNTEGREVRVIENSKQNGTNKYWAEYITFEILKADMAEFQKISDAFMKLKALYTKK